MSFVVGDLHFRRQIPELAHQYARLEGSRLLVTGMFARYDQVGQNNPFRSHQSLLL